MKNICILALIIVCLFQSTEMFSQEGTVIQGQVTEKSSGTALPGVNIVEIDAQNRIVKGVTTDINGNYRFQVSNAEHSIEVSFVGFESQTFNINSRSRIDIQLEAKTTELDEVVVTAKSQGNTLTGVAERDQTGASTKVDMDKLSGQSGVSAADALQGQVSGLDIMAASGAPGSGSSIVIRGMGTLGNANPLIVVDGMEMNVNTDDFNFAAADQHDLSQLLNVAPQDIKSVEVLKDAASTAVWGTSGANGVLLIETSTGQKGKIKFNYNYRVSANVQPPAIPMLNGDEYITMQLEQWHNAEGVYDIPPEITYDRNFQDFYNYSKNTDWLERITRDSYTHDHYFSMSGGGDRSRYFTSLKYSNNFGTTINTSFELFSFRLNFDYEVSDNLNFTANFNYNNSYRENSTNNPRGMAYQKAPNMSVWEYDEAGHLTGDYFTPINSYQGSGTQYFNPVAIASLGMNDVQKNNLSNQFHITYRINDWLTFSERLSLAFNNNKGNSFTPSSAIGADWLDPVINSSQERNSMSINFQSRSQLFIKPNFQNRDHDLNASLLWQMRQNQNQYMSLRAQNGPNVYIRDPASAAPIGGISSGNSRSRSIGALANLTYKYKDRYIAQMNLRGDESSSSVIGQTDPWSPWGVSPSASFGWRFGKENFIQSLNLFDINSKFRVSWGYNMTRPNNAYALYESRGQYMRDAVIIPSQFAVVNTDREYVVSSNAGLNLFFFDNRVSIVTDLYRKITKNMSWSGLKIPSSTGFNTSRTQNGGELQNMGWELFIRGDIIDRKDLTFGLDFNISQNFNEFLSFPENFEKQRGTDIGNGVYPRKINVGRPVGSFYGFQFLGVYPRDEDAIAVDEGGLPLIDSEGKPIPLMYQEYYQFEGGDAIYKDINHDGRIDIMDAVYIGDSSPEFIGGFGTKLKYKKFTAAVHFQYRLGFDIVNMVANETEGMSDRNNQSKAVLWRWKRPGMDYDGLLPRAYMGHPANNLGSDRYVEAGDFLRFNTLSFNYAMNQKDLGNFMGLTGLNFRFLIRKLYTFTNYSGQDPEIGRVSKNNPFFLGVDNARTPPPKIFEFSVDMRF